MLRKVILRLNALFPQFPPTDRQLAVVDGSAPCRFLAFALDLVPFLGTTQVYRMRVISRKTLKDFGEKHADAEQPLKAWFHETKAAHWKSFKDVKARYHSADILPGNRVIFNLKGNAYRLVVQLHYNTSIVFIRFIGTHAEYNRIDATTI